MAISDPFFSQGDIMRRLKALEDKLNQNSRSLEGSAIGNGGLTIYRGGSIVVLDDDDNVVMRLGRLTSGDYGLEAVDGSGNTISMSTLGFGLKTDTQSTGIFANNGANFGDYAGGSGPTVSGVVIGNTGRAIIRLSANLLAPGGEVGMMGCEISGPTNRGATGNTALQFGSLGIAGTSVLGGTCTFEFVASGLLPGSYTFQAKYQDSSGDVAFTDRTITVQPL